MKKPFLTSISLVIFCIFLFLSPAALALEITGKVINNEGAPLSGIEILYKHKSFSGYHSTTTDDTGNYVISNVESGYYTLKAWNNKYDNYDKNSLQYETLVNVTAVSRTVPDFEFVPAYNLIINLVDEEGNLIEAPANTSLPRFEFNFYNIDDRKIGNWLSASFNKTNTTSIKLPVNSNFRGSLTVYGASDDVGRFLPASDQKLYVFDDLIYISTEGSPLSQDIVMKPINRTITGRFVDPTGHPVAVPRVTEFVEDSRWPGKGIGIDLGTTNSVVAVMEGKEPKVIVNEEGSRTTPSVVAFTEDGGQLVGQIAKRQSITNPDNTIFSIKRFMGRKYDEVNEEMKMVPYKVKKASNGDAVVEARGKEYNPPEISAKTLIKLKKAAESYLGDTVTKAVITVPAYFNDSQRQATKDAGKIAGLEVLRIVNEPTASALAYGLDRKKNETIAVFDFGGGTFDISILEVGENVVEVISTNGDTHLGGDNLDQRLIEYLISEFKKDQGIDVSKDKMVLQRLKEAAEKAKIDLSSVPETEINLPFLTADSSGPKHMNLKLSRAKFESLCEDLFLRTLDPCKKALQDAKKKASDIDEVVLVGGSTRIPRVQEEVKKFFGRDPHKGVNPDEVVALGAAVQAGVLSGDVKDLLLLDVTPLTLGIETLGGVSTPLIERNTTIPTRKSQIFSTAADSQTSVEVHVLQGERPMASNNRTLGRFVLDGIPPAPRGVPQIEVSFDIDANGILNVSAKDMASNKKQHITITASSGLSKDEIENLTKEAKANEAEDKKRREEIETRNQTDALIYSAEKTLNENKEKVDAAVAKDVEDKIAEAKKAVESKDDGAMKKATEALTKATHKMAEELYKSSAAAQQQAQGDDNKSEEKKDENVVDAEFEEEKKD